MNSPAATGLDQRSESSQDLMRYRATNRRVFVNKAVDYSRIAAVGFDMDYTIAPYAAAYDELQFNLAVQNLVSIYKYPEGIRDLKYDSGFAVKGLFLDMELGNILKVDQFGYVHVATHGSCRLTEEQIRGCYKDKTIPVTVLESGHRYYLQSSAFAAPLIALFALLTDYFESQQALQNPLNDTLAARLDFHGVPRANQLCFENLFQDVNGAIGRIHGPKDDLKQTTAKYPERYIIKDERLPKMLQNLQKAGKRTFLLTNSGFEYTDVVLRYLLGNDYRNFFTYIILDAGKPEFFTGAAPFREVLQNGVLGFTKVTRLQEGKVYAHGNSNEFTKMTGLRYKEILYCGDHITGDTGATKQEMMRTLYVCPEIQKEIQVMGANSKLYRQLGALEAKRNALQQKYCSDAATRNLTEKPQELTTVQQDINVLQQKIDATFNTTFGSIFTTSWGKTWLSQYIQEHSDLYTGEIANLFNYPPFYVFSQAFDAELPHFEAVYGLVQQSTTRSHIIITLGTEALAESACETVISLRAYMKKMNDDDDKEETTELGPDNNITGPHNTSGIM